MAPFLKNHPCLRQLLPWHALQVCTLGLQMHPQPQAGKVQHGRNNCRLHDFDIRHAYKLCHEKCRCTHNRRHQLAASGGSSLNGTGKLLAVAQLLHHRDGKRAGTCHVGHGGAGHSAHQGTGQHCHLGRTAAGPPGDSVGNINKELAQPRGFQIGTKEDEQENKGRRHTQRNAENTLSSKVEMPYQLLRRQSAMAQHPRHVRTGKGVHDKRRHHHYHRNANHPAGGLNHQQHAYDAHHQVRGGNHTGTHGQLPVHNHYIGR